MNKIKKAPVFAFWFVLLLVSSLEERPDADEIFNARRDRLFAWWRKQ
jgi:hypothetical protein